MDSGYRTSKTLPVNPASTLFILRPAVTGTAEGQYLVWPGLLKVLTGLEALLSLRLRPT
jgi:hypothetical protein